MQQETFNNFKAILSNPQSPQALLQQTYQTVLFSYDSTDDPQRAPLIAIAQAAGIMAPAPVANFRSSAPAGYQPMVGIKSYEYNTVADLQGINNPGSPAGTFPQWRAQDPGLANDE